MRSRLTIAVLTIGVVVGTLLAVPAPAVAAQSRTVVSPAAPLVGETVTISGADTRGAKRWIELQLWSRTTWVKVAAVKADKRGRWTFRRPVNGYQLLRVVAPKKKSFRKSELRLTPRADVPRVVVSPGAVAVTPALPRGGRGVAVDARRADGMWTQVAGGTLRAGTTTLAVRTPPTPQEYRVRMAGWGTAPRVTTPAQTYTAPIPDLRSAAPTRIDIATKDSAPIESKEDYVKGTVTIDDVERPLRIRGRGNSTWKAPKKPYRIKLDDAASLLGMPADKDWALLANFYDLTLLKNHLTFAFGAQTSLSWTPRSRPVVLYLNDEYQGAYQLTEHVKAAADRVRVPTGGMLLEADNGVFDPELDPGDVDPYLLTGRGVPLVFKEPEDPTEAQKSALGADTTRLENLLTASGGPDPAWRDLVDLDAAADYYLAMELFKNPDGGTLVRSVFLTWRPGRFTFGPLWDFDLAMGAVKFEPEKASPIGWYVRRDASKDWHPTHWMAYMLDDPVFAEHVAERWRELSPVAHALATQTTDSIATLEEAGTTDYDLWEDAPRPFLERYADSYRGEAEQVVEWLEERTDWMDEQLG